MFNLKKVAAVVFMIFCCNSAVIAEATGFLDKRLLIDDVKYRYQVFIPKAYAAEKKWPVILFLHGVGSRGNDGRLQTRNGLGPSIREAPQRWPVIAVFPQAGNKQSWAGVSTEIAMLALETTLSEYSTDKTRIYLTGISMGGNGAWYLGYHFRDRFAAIVPICGYIKGPPKISPVFRGAIESPYHAVARRLAATPVWIFHGDADPMIPVSESQIMGSASP